MRTLPLFLLAVLWGVPSACADVTVIYRRSDRTVAGWVKPPHSVEVEIKNLTKSELGGVPEDYATATVSDAQWAAKKDRDITVDGNGAVVFVSNPKAQAKKASKQAAKNKLKALGLTPDELDALLDD
jgi:hypothetical protein